MAKTKKKPKKKTGIDAEVQLRERVVALLFQLMRDVAPAGTIIDLVRQIAQYDGFDFDEPELEELARAMAHLL